MIPNDDWSEAAVRESCIYPLLQRLGYERGGQNDLRSDVCLRYPTIYIGRRKPGPKLTAFADYQLEAEGKIRWVIEAKAPNETFDQDAINQAYSYAIHPEVKAVYYALCNGRRLIIFRTANAPNSPAILDVELPAIGLSYHAIENTVGPAALLRRFPAETIDFGQPLGIGFPSTLQVRGGYWIHDHGPNEMRRLLGVSQTVVGGVIQRYEDGRIGALIMIRASHETIQKLLTQLGLDRFECISGSTSLPTDPTQPMSFVCEQSATFPAGTKMLDMESMKEIESPLDITSYFRFEAQMVLRNLTLSGTFEMQSTILEFNYQYSTRGRAELVLAGS